LADADITGFRCHAIRLPTLPPRRGLFLITDVAAAPRFISLPHAAGFASRAVAFSAIALQLYFALR